MGWIGLILLVAVMVPVLTILLDSPIGRAIARRMEGPENTPPGVLELAKRVELLESEVDDLTRAIEGLKDENAFLQRLLEDTASRPSLPPRPAP
jgi:hypothetical protein